MRQAMPGFVNMHRTAETKCAIRRSWRLAGSPLILFQLMLLFCLPCAAEGPSEYDVKAAFLVNFMKYIEWQPVAARTAGTICILGKDPFGQALDDMARSPEGNLKIRRLDSAAAAADCRLLYLAPQAGDLPGGFDLMTAPSGVVTVSDTENFIDHGGTIGFLLEGKQVRFEISLTSAGRAGVKISSRLLGLARRVIGAPG